MAGLRPAATATGRSRAGARRRAVSASGPSSACAKTATSARARHLAWRVAAPALVGILASAPAAVVAQEGGPSAPVLSALRLSEGDRVELDGKILEAVWQRAVPIDDFVQQEPVEGASPSERTEIRVAFDADDLYIAAMFYDDPEGILAYQRQRDAGLGTDDRFMWILDTFLDGRTGYFFEINPAGLMGDGIISGGGGRGGGVSKAWDGIWEARTARRADGWSAEIRIPFRTLNFNPELDAWGINFQRTIRRRNEEALWRGHRRNEGLWRPVYAGRLTGLQGMSQGLGLEARPSAVASWKNVPDGADPTTFPKDVSLDVSYSLTSSLRLSASVNTDFAEVESDQRRVNLTRFPQRFPERRAFFLEGSGVFSFAPRSGPTPFFSRRIGLRDGEQIPIQYGARLTGQVGRFELGLYQVGAGSHAYGDGAPDDVVHLPRESFTVLRAKRSIGEQSSIGVIYTRRAASPAAGAAGHTAGADLQLDTRRFFGDNRLEMEAFLVWNSNPDPTVQRSFGDLSARGFRFNFPNDIWSAHLSYREFGDNYDPTLGFVRRNGFRRVEPRVGWAPRPSGIDWIRRFDFAVQFRNLVQLGTGVLEEREWQFDVFGLDFESGDNIEVQATRTTEFLDYGFEVSDGVGILAGEYTNWEWEFEGRTAGRRRVSVSGMVAAGGFWDGTRARMNAGLTYRPNPGVSVSLDFEHNDVALPRGNFTADVYEAEAEWNPSPWISLVNQLQYDDESRILGLFARLRWILHPGNDMFLVYTHNWRNLSERLLRDARLATISKGAAVKVNYTYRF